MSLDSESIAPSEAQESPEHETTNGRSIPIVDAQVHVWAANQPDRPWAGTSHGADEVTGAQTVALLDDFSIDGAILVSPWSVYRFDPSYALEVATQFPARFRVVAPVNIQEPGARGFVDHWLAEPFAVGLRLMVRSDDDRTMLESGVADSTLKAIESAGMPICVACSDRVEVVAPLAERFPDLPLVVDHLGIAQPKRLPVPPHPFRNLNTLLRLARYPNVFVKVTGAPTLSHEPYPFADLWPPLHQVMAAFGIDRCMWGTDWTRTTSLVSYEEALRYVLETDELSDADKRELLAQTTRRVFSWPEAVGQSP